jgi:Rap1a immunity proteins
MGIGPATAQQTGNKYLMRARRPCICCRSAGYVSGANDKTSVDVQVLRGRLFMNLNDKMRNMVADDGTLKSVQNRSEAAEFSNEQIRAAENAMSSYCTPDGVIVALAADLFCKYLKDNPAERQKDAAELLVAALSSAWPCKK